jgi:hypothetical protein
MQDETVKYVIWTMLGINGGIFLVPHKGILKVGEDRDHKVGVRFQGARS